MYVCVYIYVCVCVQRLSGSKQPPNDRTILTTLNMTSSNCIHESMKVNIIVKKEENWDVN